MHPLFFGADLEAELVPVYKSVMVFPAYLVLYGPDVAFISKESCRAVSRTTAKAWVRLKHVTRYLLGILHLQWVFMRWDPVLRLEDLRFRLSGSGGGITTDQQSGLTPQQAHSMGGCVYTKPRWFYSPIKSAQQRLPMSIATNAQQVQPKSTIRQSSQGSDGRHGGAFEG